MIMSVVLRWGGWRVVWHHGTGQAGVAASHQLQLHGVVLAILAAPLARDWLSHIPGTWSLISPSMDMYTPAAMQLQANWSAAAWRKLRGTLLVSVLLLLLLLPPRAFTLAAVPSAVRRAVVVSQAGTLLVHELTNFSAGMYCTFTHSVP
jgi:ABC-type transport system involved in cytochrome c biogenesis permease component